MILAYIKGTKKMASRRATPHPVPMVTLATYHAGFLFNFRLGEPL
jgi:hypothetical protein